jgi:hypothetical protein
MAKTKITFNYYCALFERRSEDTHVTDGILSEDEAEVHMIKQGNDREDIVVLSVEYI